MKKPINEIERLKLIAGLINEIDYNEAMYGIKKISLTEGQTKEAKADEAVKAEVKAKAPSTKKPSSLHIDQANPYEYRHGLQYELNELGEYTDEALEKAKDKVLKNLAKDANFYSNLLNAQQSPYTFKQTETDKPGMQAKADGHLKKEAKKDEKSNVQDSLGKKEAGKKKPKGVKVMPDKGVTGSEKTIKEGLEVNQDDDQIEISDKSGDYTGFVEDGKVSFTVTFDEDEDNNVDESNWKEFLGPKHAFVKIIDTIGGDVEALGDYVQITVDAEKLLNSNIKEGSFMGGVDLGASFDKMKGDMSTEDEFEKLMSKYDWYAEFSDDPSKWSAQQSMEGTLRQLAKKIGVDRAVEIYNSFAPSNRKVTSSHFMNEDKHAKLKETLKAKLKEALTTADLQQAKRTGKTINIPKDASTDIKAAQNAKVSYTTYE